MKECPCGSAKPLATCCGPYLEGAPAPTAEAVMRSRYSAHVLGNADYLAATLSEDQRADHDEEQARQSFADTKWLGLEIRRTELGGEADETGQVEFVARYRSGQQHAVHHELSYFTREEGRWVFAGCKMNPKAPTVRVEKIGRNAPCTCGSGKKYKKCCGA
ncbi:MAG: YchJ family protein [Alphaproteobacteria bacterium]|jgi:SEC-C motif-containing protein|nr:YchJ family protein [Alphaproteobacteria bacterium]MDP6814164.1 YchJ family protein [Alphaproteobacteria bacterium]|tara:strand:- start:110 stop:592 length:483 start_codon:yes stop_codon:yes gene_type:complete